MDEGGGGPERVGGMSSLPLFIILFCKVLYLLVNYTCYCCCVVLYVFCIISAFMFGCYVALQLLLPAFIALVLAVFIAFTWLLLLVTAHLSVQHGIQH